MVMTLFYLALFLKGGVYAEIDLYNINFMYCYHKQSSCPANHGFTVSTGTKRRHFVFHMFVMAKHLKSCLLLLKME